MSWIGRALSSVSQYYKEINPATLSGAIDVIVVETTTKDGNTELACSPFHVRYGKLSVLRPVDRKVYIKINDKDAPFHMKVGDTGEAFFVFETDQEVPAYLQTSPLAGPTPDDEADRQEGEPEPLDLGDSVATLKVDGSTSKNSKESEDEDSQISRSYSPSSPDTSSSPLPPGEQASVQAEHDAPTAKLMQGASKGAQVIGTLVRDIAGHGETLEHLTHHGRGRRNGKQALDGKEDEDEAAAVANGDKLDDRATSNNDDRNQEGSSRISGILRNKKEKDNVDSRSDPSSEAFLATDASNLLPPYMDDSSAQTSAGVGITGPPSDSTEQLQQVPVSAFSQAPSTPALEALHAGDLREKEDADLGSHARRLAAEAQESFESSYGRMRISESPMPEERDDRQPDSSSQQNGIDVEPFGGHTKEISSSSAATTTTSIADRRPSLMTRPTSSPRTDALMLDMEGYKMEDAETRASREAEEEAAGMKTPPLQDLQKLLLESEKASEELHNQDADVMAFTRALLRYSEPNNESIASSNTSHIPDPQAKADTKAHREAMARAADPQVFVMLSEGTTMVFEIAVCPTPKAGSEQKGDEDVAGRHAHRAQPLPSHEEFTSHRLSNEDFLKSPEKLEDRHLYIRYRDRIFGWDNGANALTSLAIYRRALLDKQPKVDATSGGGTASTGSSSAAAVGASTTAKQSTGGTWKRWWPGRSRTTTEGSETSAGAPASSDATAGGASTPASTASARDDDRASVLSTDPIVDGVQHPQLSVQGHPPPRAASEPPMPYSPPLSPPSPALSASDTIVGESKRLQELDKECLPAPTTTTMYAKTLRLTSDQLKQLDLKKGKNEISFTVQSSFSGVAVITARIFLWESDYQVVISDIDGTITKSDALGHVFTMIGRDWTHPGVAKLYTDIARNGYKFLYLTSRAVGQADVTREYLRGIQQNGYRLPEGPVIMSPDRLLTSLHREVVLRKPEVFKMACLRDIKRLFGDRNPFYSGFGNRLTDGLSYRSVEIPSSRIFTIDSYGNVKLELLELAGYTSSYIAMANLVNETFPPAQRSSEPEYNDFNYWRPALPGVELPDLATLLPDPVSPALSARSDGTTTSTSRMSSVFRVGALAGALSKRASRNQLNKAGNADANSGTTKSPPISRAASPSSPLMNAYSNDDIDELDLEANNVDNDDDTGRYGHSGDDRDDGQQQRRKSSTRRIRTDSMPGSYEDESYLESMRNEEEMEEEERREASFDQPREPSSGAGGHAHDPDDDDLHNLEEGQGGEGDEDEEEDDIPEMDFGNVPYL